MKMIWIRKSKFQFVDNAKAQDFQFYLQRGGRGNEGGDMRYEI